MQCSKWPWPPVTPPPASRLLFGCNPNLGIIKYGRKRGAAAVRKRIHPALTIVRDKSPDGHGLHRIVGDANRAVNNAGRDAVLRDQHKLERAFAYFRLSWRATPIRTRDEIAGLLVTKLLCDADLIQPLPPPARAGGNAPQAP
jgi:hypothetical protein